jgi:hypothetical protein
MCCSVRGVLEPATHLDTTRGKEAHVSQLARITIDADDLRDAFGMGVAGNFAGHLEQAGEAVDFVNVDAAAQLPKGIFPWHVPGASGRLGRFPLSSTLLAVPDPEQDPGRIQVEPELAVLCDVHRADDHAVSALRPRWIAAFDDCSLRRPNAAKISDKKNWGDGSKGLAATGFAATDLDRDGALAQLRLACLLQRDGELHEYGVDSEVATYTLAGEPLLDWLVDRLHHQRGAADTPLEDVGALLDASGADTVLVGIGATRYEPFGESTFVQPGDEAIVVLYDGSIHSPEQVRDRLHAGTDDQLYAASVLRRAARSR